MVSKGWENSKTQCTTLGYGHLPPVILGRRYCILHIVTHIWLRAMSSQNIWILQRTTLGVGGTTARIRGPEKLWSVDALRTSKRGRKNIFLDNCNNSGQLYRERVGGGGMGKERECLKILESGWSLRVRR